MPEKHGMTYTPEYKAWCKMKERCYLKTSNRYELYGGRGIAVCNEWLHSFSTFYKDMGVMPEGMTLDRKDSNGNYCKGNCRWATQKEQQRNRRNTLTVYAVSVIKYLLQTGEYTQKRISKAYRVSESTITAINTEQNWADVEALS